MSTKSKHQILEELETKILALFDDAKMPSWEVFSEMYEDYYLKHHENNGGFFQRTNAQKILALWFYMDIMQTLNAGKMHPSYRSKPCKTIVMQQVENLAGDMVDMSLMHKKAAEVKAKLHEEHLALVAKREPLINEFKLQIDALIEKMKALNIEVSGIKLNENVPYHIHDKETHVHYDGTKHEVIYDDHEQPHAL